MKNVKLKDFRQGVTLYYVMAFPLESKGGNATVEPYSIQTKAYLKPKGKGALSNILAGARWYKHSHQSKYFPKRMLMEHSCCDSGVNVGKSHYNFHRLFHTRKQAQRYADRMNSGCLTHEERQNAMRLVERSMMWDDFDYYGWDE